MIISQNETLINMFKMLASKKDLKNKKIEILFYDNKKESDIQAVYIDREHLNLYDAIYSIYENSNTLLISDNYNDKRAVMINLLQIGSKITFEINKANIINRDLAVSADMVLLGGTEIDVAALYRSSQEDLKEQKEIVSSLSKDIEEKNRELANQLVAIETQKAVILEQTKNIKIQSDSIELQKLELDEIYKSIKDQRKKLDTAQKQTEEKEKNIDKLIDLQKEKEKSFEKAKKDLDLLLAKIDEQNRNIILKEEAIKNQKNIITVFSVLFIIILILGFNSIRQNRRLKQNNIVIDSMLNETRTLHKQLKDSIDYALMIQTSLISKPKTLEKYFKESYAVWIAKDVVGGDIYIFEEISEDECLIFVIDCTGHSVPGALVTVLVRAIERNIYSDIINGVTKDISPANMLSIFNKTIKSLLDQNQKHSLSNAGFDGSILYYNARSHEMKFASANSVIMLLRDGEIIEFKGDRHSVGYKTSDNNFAFTEESILLLENDQLFISTDGLYDQNGGAKDLPLGRKKIKDILIKNRNSPLQNTKNKILNELENYQGSHDRNDDISFVSFKI